jgi:predicted dehydrogenase
MAAKTELRVCLVGYGFMGRAHSHAWRNVGRVFDVLLKPRLAVISSRRQSAVDAAMGSQGWSSGETDWAAAVARDDVDLIDICTPNATHAEIAVAALAAGKHVLCEKPLARTVEEAERMAEAAREAGARGVRAMVGFNYRRVPAIALARTIIADGRLGEIRHVRASYMQDWALDPELPLLWRFVESEGGTGAIGDMASHIVDLAQHLLGDRITRVSATVETFIGERPRLDGGGTGAVTVDDASAFLAGFAGGALGTFEVTRLAPGRKNALRLEVNGSTGSLGWDLERLNELELYRCEGDEGLRGFRTVLLTESAHPWISAWWPPGHIIGWEHTFTHEVRDLLEAIADERDPEPSFSEGLAVQRVLDAVVRSAREGTWVELAAAAGSAA